LTKFENSFGIHMGEGLV